MYEKVRPKRDTQNKAILTKYVYFGAKLALEFHPETQKLDRPTPHIIISDLCRENLAELFACTEKCHQHYFLRTLLPFGWSPIINVPLIVITVQKICP